MFSKHDVKCNVVLFISNFAFERKLFICRHRVSKPNKTKRNSSLLIQDDLFLVFTCPVVPTYELQPTNPSDDYGYVQLTRDEGQGLVCVQHLTDHSAHLLCREAGYVAGMTFSRSLTPASPGPVWAAELNCSKEAVDINGCMGGEWTLLQQAPDWCQPARVFCFPSEGKVIVRRSALPLTDGQLILLLSIRR